MGALPFLTSIGPHRGFFTMAFPYSRSTSEMAQYVIRNFEWDQRGVAFPLSPLSNDFQALCPSYDLAMVEKAARQAERLGVLQWRTLHIMESALTELRWSTFELWVWLNGDRIMEARFREKAKPEDGSSDVEGAAFPSNDDEQERKGREREREWLSLPPSIMAFPPLCDTKEMADFVRESFRWHWRSSTRPPRPLPGDY
ncbi:hypothetical protein Cgig2_010982 [Carnegiea gigantea]|uniref:Uncharacterized protein n=1 Tax=Carnegiea gigantea TaxID=171969 RepID=A0A9Q1Q9C2_9CARY|nr:hypothetical protein Cgig2_010982 [Carnegiea gigantea]